MRLRTATGAALLSSIVLFGTVLTGQSPPSRPQLLVTNDPTSRVTVWRMSATGYDKVWEGKPRALDPAAKPPGDAIAPSRDASLVIADCDGDGTNEVLLIDGFGLTIYGAKPAYYSFDQVSDSSYQAVAVGDVDGDGTPEIVVQRVLTNGTEPARHIVVMRRTASGLATVSDQKLAQAGYSLALGDVDNDKQLEIVSGGSGGFTILKRRGSSWEPIADTATMGGAAAVLIADVDKDNKNEVVCASSGIPGRVSVHKYRKNGDRVAWPTMWQSPSLLTEGMKQSKTSGRPYCIVPDIAVADVDGDGQKELLVASLEFGNLNGEDLASSGRLHVFKFDSVIGDFRSEWVSERSRSGWAAGISAGDVDGDGVSEIAYYGRSIFKHVAEGKGYKLLASGCPTCNASAIGDIGELREPVGATRIVPVAWSIPRSQVVQGQTLDFALTLRSVWSEAKNVSVKVVSADAGLEVPAGSATTASIPAAGNVTLSGLQVKGSKAGTYARVTLTVSADGFQQSVPLRVMVGSPLPTYKTVTDAGIAETLEAARGENQRVLIVWGSNADKTSQAFLETTVKNPELSHELLYEYSVVRADATTSQRIASKYGAAVKSGDLPHLTVLRGDGKVLANAPALAAPTAPPAATPAATTAAGAPAAALDVKPVVALLKKHEAAPQDANQLLKAALDRAKTESKTVFIWFSAPW